MHGTKYWWKASIYIYNVRTRPNKVNKEDGPNSMNRDDGLNSEIRAKGVKIIM